jgi:magnesium-transporting ATPase (P-type)
LREGNYNFNVCFEDYNRYKSDKQLNFESKTKVRRSGKFIEVTWSEVLIGDIVLVE